MESSSFLRTGEVIADRYELLEIIGTGSTGSVFRVYDRVLDSSQFAFKLLHPMLVNDEEHFGRFKNEAQLMRDIVHRNIVRLHDIISVSSQMYFISMEFIEGSTLRELLCTKSNNALPLEEAVKMLWATASGLSYAHQHNVIHRDLKPENILVGINGEIKVSDFGYAKGLTQTQSFTAHGKTVGTPDYMAPEQLRGERIDRRCDIYALGIMAYEIVVGEKPFAATNYLKLANLHLSEPLPKFADGNAIPFWYEEFVEKCTAKNRAERFSSMDDVKKALRNMPTQKKKFGFSLFKKKN